MQFDETNNNAFLILILTFLSVFKFACYMLYKVEHLMETYPSYSYIRPFNISHTERNNGGGSRPLVVAF